MRPARLELTASRRSPEGGGEQKTQSGLGWMTPLAHLPRLTPATSSNGGNGTYLRVMSDAEPDADQPDWAISWERREDGRTVYRDQDGELLVALAVTRDDLRRLESGLQLLPESEATRVLLDRLAVLHLDLAESAE